MWIQFRTSKMLYIAGKPTQFRAGDWCDVGKSVALRLIETGEATTTDITKLAVFTTSDVDRGIFFAANKDRGMSILGRILGPANWSTELPILRWLKTMYWDASTVPALEVIPTAWDLLDRWEVVAPLLSYDTLAKDIGTPEDRALTEALILDLRVPVYDTRVIFLRKCQAIEDLMAAWAGEPGDRRLAFMRALWTVKPLILSTPATWADRGAHDREKWPRK